MGPLIFAIVWTTLTGAILLFASKTDLNPFERAIFISLPIFGLLFIWHSWVHLRRRRSLRSETVGGVTLYFWVETSGHESCSTTDPRPDWDAADGDGDGDGGGGD